MAMAQDPSDSPTLGLTSVSKVKSDDGRGLGHGNAIARKILEHAPPPTERTNTFLRVANGTSGQASCVVAPGAFPVPSSHEAGSARAMKILEHTPSSEPIPPPGLSTTQSLDKPPVVTPGAFPYHHLTRLQQTWH